MSDRPLATLLSQVLVAFTIECDNAFEQRAPHSATSGPARAAGRQGPWLTSLAMWSNFLRFLDEDGVPLADLTAAAAITNLDGLQRWRYITVDDGGIVRPTAGWVEAGRLWPQVLAETDAGWRRRFGTRRIAALRTALRPLADRHLPHCLPVVGFAHGMRVDREAVEAAGARSGPPDSLVAQLSGGLLAFTLDYEAGTTLSLTLGADLLRVLGTGPTPVRDVPALGGVSKEGVAAALGFLGRRDLVIVASRDRVKTVTLTETGRRARAGYVRRVRSIERDWREQHGDDRIDAVRAALAGVLDHPDLRLGLEPPSAGWRANPPYVRRTEALLAGLPDSLPHHPMVLHRGGYPDGS